MKTEDGLSYFVDIPNKTTSWIDPRTKNTRITNIKDISFGELPYGWDEGFNEDCGHYFIVSQNGFRLYIT